MPWIVLAVFVALSCALLALVARLAWSKRGRDARSRRLSASAKGCLAAAFVALAGVLGVAAYLFEPFVAPERYLGEVERASAPLVAALTEFEREHGAPPQHLSELVPSRLAELPPTGFRGGARYDYRVLDGASGGAWQLGVACDPLSSRPARFVFDSRERRWRFERAGW